MQGKVQTTVCLGLLLLLPGSLSQVIFPDAGTTTLATTAATSATTILPFIVNNSSNICICTAVNRCFIAGGAAPTDGSGLIDIRIVSTATGTATGSVTPITSVISSGITTLVQSQSFCQTNLQLCCTTAGYSCGLRYTPLSFAPAPTGAQSYFGSFPWQGVILTSGNLYVGTGVLIDHMHLLTVAHKVNAFLTNGVTLKVRMGAWDAANIIQPIPSQDFNVIRIFVNPNYNSASLSNSVAILRLSPNVPLGQVPSITTGCLSSAFITGIRCWVSGWGQQSFTAGSYQTIQTHVDVPIVDQTTCQAKLRTTRLGSGFTLDTNSFMCAGGEAGKDACTGDGGSPLMCPVAGKWYVVGLVAWGIGCGTTDVPGVYINVTNFITWIQTTTNTP